MHDSVDHAVSRGVRSPLVVIVLNYRTPGMTIDCLASLVDEVVGCPGTHVFVVDNASGDASCELIGAAIDREGWGSWCTLIASKMNGGFAAGNNIALREAQRIGGFEFAWLLNSDTVVRPGAGAVLLEFLRDRPDVGIVGSRLQDPDGTPQVSAFRFPGVLSSFEGGVRIGFVSMLLRRWVVALPVSDTDTRVDWVCGASMMIRSAVFDRIGLMDDAYFMYFEETDFCLAAAREGFGCWYVPRSRVVHLVGQASGVTAKSAGQAPGRRRPKYWFDSRRRYYIKNHGWVVAALADAAWMAGYSIHRLRCAITRKKVTDPERMWRDSLVNSALLHRLGARGVPRDRSGS